MLLRLEPRGQRSRLWTYASPLLALGLTVITSAVIFSVLGKDPLESLYVFLISPLTSETGLPELFVKAAPLILIGVGLSLGFRANVWNIGAEGQYTLGAIFAAGVALRFPDAPALLLIPAMMVLGVLGGMTWAAVPAYLRTRWNANEILTSLMLTYVAQLLLIYLVTGPWRDPEGYGFPQTALFSESATSPVLVEGTRVHLGVLVAFVVAIVGWIVLTRSVIGFQLRVLGQAPRAARFAGFSQDRLIWLSLMVGGGLAGLAGMFEVSGTVNQLTP
ncbi:MAG TPA: ABC transporter permease, partial [Dongiaceae bacterium]